MKTLALLSILLIAGCVEKEKPLSELTPPIVVVNTSEITQDEQGYYYTVPRKNVILADSSGHLFSFTDDRFAGLKKGDTLSK